MKVNHNTMQKKCIKILVRVIFSFQTNEFFFFILKNNLKILTHSFNAHRDLLVQHLQDPNFFILRIS